MKTYDVSKDLYLIRQFYRLTQDQLAREIGTTRLNIVRWEKSYCFPRASELERIYSFAFKEEGIPLDINRAKEMLYADNKGSRVLLFHGTDTNIVSDPDNNHSTPPNDFGAGFYLGESLLQAATWVNERPGASVYVFYLNPDQSLRKATFSVDRRWMNAILYYRGALDGYILDAATQKIIDEVERSDYLIAPIADNQMYDILAMFKRGEITDEACVRSLSCSNLGYQYVLKSERIFRYLECVDRLYLCEKEKRRYQEQKTTQARDSENKAQLARITYRREGKYFDELYKKRG